MDLYYIVEIHTPKKHLESFEAELSSEFKDVINDIKLFCRLFGFRISETKPCWGEESESAYYLREAYLSITIYKKIGLFELGVIMPAVQGFLRFKKLGMADEIIHPHSKGVKRRS